MIPVTVGRKNERSHTKISLTTTSGMGSVDCVDDWVFFCGLSSLLIAPLIIAVTMPRATADQDGKMSSVSAMQGI